MRPFERIIWIVLDSVGIGALPDAADYDDVGRNTLGHIAKSRPLALPNLVSLGLANIAPLHHLTPAARPEGCYGKGATHSPGKDTTTGHWEMAGIWLPQAFPVYKHGFPLELIEEFERAIGRKTIGNKPASGTEIIKELGEEHVRTGFPIVYTSGDSVFQIATHEDVIPIVELYRMCEIARKMLDVPNKVGRVIARPFVGESIDDGADLRKADELARSWSATSSVRGRSRTQSSSPAISRLATCRCAGGTLRPKAATAWAFGIGKWV
jgi:phosphopentomutase